MYSHKPKKVPQATIFLMKTKRKDRLSITKVYRGVKNSFKNKLCRKYQTPKVSKQHTVGKIYLALEV